MSNTRKKFQKSDIDIIKWMMKIGKSQIGKIVLLVVVNAIAATTSIVFANFSKNIIDGAVEYKSLNYVIKYAVFLLILIMVQLLLKLVGQSFEERTKARLEMIYKQYFLDQIMKKDYSEITKIHTGELQNRMFNDVYVVTEGFVTMVPSVVSLVTRLVCAFAYLIVIDKTFAFIFLIGGLIIAFCCNFFRKTIKRLHKRVQESEGKTRSFIQEAILNLLVVKVFVVEDKISKETDELQEENYKHRMRRRLFSITANAGISTVFNIGYVFALGYGGYALLNGFMTYGTITAMLQLVNQVQAPFSALTGILPKYFALLASAERLMEIEKIPDEIESNTDDIDVEKTYEELKCIDFNNITFKYDRDLVLDETSLKINKGDFIAIMGISGIGKSTLLKLLLGVFIVQDGSITLDLESGKIPVDLHTRRLFSYVPQGNMILSGTIRDNLTFINDNATDEEIEEAIKISCAKDFIDELPNGIETVIGEKGLGLSEGQLQRLAIARSLLSNSPVILLDEATSALDEMTEKKFLTNLKSLKNVTCIIISHKKAALEICNKHVEIIDNKIVTEEV